MLAQSDDYQSHTYEDARYARSSFLQPAGLLHLEHQLPSSSFVCVVEGSHDLIFAFEYFVLDGLDLFGQEEFLLYVCLQFLELFFTCLDLVLCLPHCLVLFVLYLATELLVLAEEALTI